MKTSDFYYDLPKELIAQTPIPDRSASRLLVFRRDLVLFFQRTSVRIAIGAVLALIVLIIILRLTVFNRRRRYGRGYTGPRSGGYRGRRR